MISGLGQLSGVVQSLGDLATQGISSLSGVVQQGVDGVLALQDVAQQVPSDPAADDPTAGPHQSAEFDLAGKHLKFEMGPNGELQVVTTDGDGQHATYELRLDEQGRPIIAVDDRSPDAPTGESPHRATSRPAVGTATGRRPTNRRRVCDHRSTRAQGRSTPVTNHRKPPGNRTPSILRRPRRSLRRRQWRHPVIAPWAIRAGHRSRHPPSRSTVARSCRKRAHCEQPRDKAMPDGSPPAAVDRNR